MTTKKTNAVMGFVSPNADSGPVGPLTDIKPVSVHVSEQNRMLEDIKNGTFQPDFISDLPKSGKPNPFLQMMEEWDG